MALLDMGAEYHFYGSDITCSYPVSLSIIRLTFKNLFWSLYIIDLFAGDRGISSIQLIMLSTNWSYLFKLDFNFIFLLVQINGKFTSDQSLIYNVSAFY
jgi:nicotinamide riboside transporter PnuC